VIADAAGGQRRFPQNPHFYFLEAESYFTRAEHQVPFGRVQDLLEEAERHAGGLPPDERNGFLARIRERQEAVHAMNPFASLLEGFAETVFGGPEEYDEEEPWDEEPSERPRGRRRY
jgi:hypothetical protein